MHIKQFISSHRALSESFFSLSALNIIESLLPLLTLPYILRIVGTAHFGQYSYIMTLVQYCLILNVYGFNFSATKQISQHRDDINHVNRVYSSVISCRLILFIISILVILIFSPILLQTKQELFMFFMGLGIVLGDSLNPVWLFQGMEKMRYMTIINASAKIFFTLLIFIFIRNANDYVFLILYQSLGYLTSGVLSIIIAYRIFNIKFKMPTWEEIIFQFKDGFAVFSSTIGMNLYRNANIFILKFFVNDAALGIYSAAEKIIKGIQMLTNPIAQSLFPHMSKTFHLRSTHDNLIVLRRTSLIIFSILTTATLVTILFAKWIVQLFCGQAFIDTIPLVRLMAPIITIAGMNYTLGIIGLVNLNRAKLFTYSVFTAGIISFATVMISAPTLGIYAGAWAMLVAEFVLLICIIGSLIYVNHSTTLTSSK